jgi:hypothetical protein
MDSGIPRIAQVVERTAKAPWVLVQMVSLPSVDHKAVDTCGSI